MDYRCVCVWISRQTQSCQATLQVDGPSSSARVQLGMSFVFASFRLTHLSTFYVGGVPSNVTYVNQPQQNFIGCISIIVINNKNYGFQEARNAVSSTCYNSTVSLFSSDILDHMFMTIRMSQKILE